MKHPFVAKRYWKNQKTAMGAVDELAKAYEGVIDLSLGDPDQTTDERIIDFAFSEAKKGHTRYTDFRGDPELRQAIRTYYEEDFVVDLADEEIMVTASACLGMYLALEATLDPGDEVIIHGPYFTPYYQQIELAGGVPVELETRESDGFQIDPVELEKKINERTKVIVVNAPNNPTGAVFSRETLEAVARIARKHDLLVIADEIYGAYTFGVPFLSMITLEHMRDRLIVINSYSKDFTMTGWRVGQLIGPLAIISTCQQINENVVFTAPSISQRAALFALRHRKEIQPSMVALYEERVRYAADRIAKIPWLSILPPQGTFYLFANIKGTGRTSAEVSEMLLREAHVLTIPGHAFGRSGEGYIRFAVTVGLERLAEAFDRLEQVHF